MLDSKLSPQGRCLRALAILIGGGMTANATPPVWWNMGNPPALDPSLASAPDKNISVANIGQAKWMVSEALSALLLYSPDVAHQIMTDLDGTLSDQSDRIIDLGVPEAITAEWQDQQHATLLVHRFLSVCAFEFDRIELVV